MKQQLSELKEQLRWIEKEYVNHVNDSDDIVDGVQDAISKVDSLIESCQEQSKESDAKIVIEDVEMDKYINKYINDLPENWTTKFDMNIAMKNAMIEAVSFYNKYTTNHQKPL